MSNTEITSKVEWAKIEWPKAEFYVAKLQKRIFRASESGNIRQVHRLQKTLTRSYYARCLAVRKVTQDNQGKRTAGVDGVKFLSSKQRMTLVSKLKFRGKSKPTRRVMIPKKGTEEKRPLGIPTILDRALQALAKLALEPEWEQKFEARSYGFRPGRSAHDAIEDIFCCINKKDKWVLDADIAKCFDRINHSALIEKVNTYPSMRKQIKAWLKSGVIEKGVFTETEAGTPQGGVISPLLANIALTGMTEYLEKGLHIYRKKRRGIYKIGALIRYADDFLYIDENREMVEEAKRLIGEFLAGIGLEYKDSKTKIVHTTEGFNFLGFNIRHYEVGKYDRGTDRYGNRYAYKTLIKPSKEAVKKHLRDLTEVIDNNKHASQEALIINLNRRIRGWCNYYLGVVSKKVFTKCDHQLFLKLMAWAVRRSSGKSRGIKRIISKYWKSIGTRNWVFSYGELKLIRHADTRIVRHTKVKGNRSPYEGDDIYWSLRLRRSPTIPLKKVNLLKAQKGKCAHCKAAFKQGDLMEIDHKIPRSQGGQNKYANLQLLHKHCHDSKTKTDGSLKRRGTHEKS